MTEIWKSVVGYEGRYEVSDRGRVRSLDRIVESPTATRGYPKQVIGRLLKPQNHSAGYVSVTIGGRLRLINHLVLEAFVGPRPDGMEACHTTGNKRDNRLSKLRWDTHIANCADRVEHGTASCGESNGQAKLNRAAVLDIRSGGDKNVLAARYGVNANHINRIRARGRWAHV